ncbi:MAG: MFS transporter [Sporomusaceae bacterium]|nr:MFS transporter [Sporomusaceae bacterium]
MLPRKSNRSGITVEIIETRKPWWQEITISQWKALAAAFFGYTLDSFDVMVYAFALTTIVQEMQLTTISAGFLASLTLFASSFGGVLFGIVSDRFGRKKGIMLTISIFAVFSFLSGISQNVIQLALARTCLGIGMGGQWTAGVLLLAETWPPRHRAKAMGLMQSGWALGYVLAALATIMLLPSYGWRALFMIGLLPATCILWLVYYIDETVHWKKAQAQSKESRMDFFQIFRPALRRYTVVITLISTLLMLGYWGLFSWLPSYLSMPVEKGGAGLSIVRSSQFMIPVMIGAWLGYVTYGFFADRMGRRPVFSFYLMIAACLVYFYGTSRDPEMLFLLGPFVGFFGSGAFSGFGAFASEIFPTQARGFGTGFTYNMGRIFSAGAPLFIGYLALFYGLGSALLFTGAAYFLAAAAIFLLPETKGRELE